MKKIIYISIIAIFTASLTSCGSVSNVSNNSEVAGYTLKNKKEQMQQKILNTKSKTVIVAP